MSTLHRSSKSIKSCSTDKDVIRSTKRQHYPAAHLNGVLANAESVPQLDGLVPRARHDLAVISREGHAQNILGVSNKLAGGEPSKKCHIYLLARGFQ